MLLHVGLLVLFPCVIFKCATFNYVYMYFHEHCMKQVGKSIFTFQSIQSITRRALSRAYTSAKVQQSTLTTNDGQDIRYPPLHGMTKLSPNRNTVLPAFIIIHPFIHLDQTRSINMQKQEAQLMLTTGSTRLAVSRSRSTNMVPFWIHCDFSLSM